MAVSVASDGSQTTVITTEHTLYDTSAVGIYQLDLDLNALAAGDILEVRIYKMVRASGTRRVLYLQTYADAQIGDDQIKTSIPVTTPITDSGALRFTIKQTTGSVRAIPWSVTKF